MKNEAETADLLYGVPAIAAFLQMREKQVRHRVDAGLIPSFRIGGTVCARRSAIKAWLDNCEAKSKVEVMTAGQGHLATIHVR